MTSFRLRVMAVLLLAFAALPALAQDSTAGTTLSSSASIGCVFVGIIALLGVGALAMGREAQGEPDTSVQPSSKPGTGDKSANPGQ